MLSTYGADGMHHMCERLTPLLYICKGRDLMCVKHIKTKVNLELCFVRGYTF